MILRSLGIGFLCLFILGCSDEDVDALRRDLDKQAARLAALEAWQAEMNANLSVLQELVDALKNSKYITSVTETSGGYTVGMNDGSVLHIRHGEKGDAGECGGILMPAISVRDSSDGHTYWTVDGLLLLDASGHAVRADGDRGASGDPGFVGKPGVSPQVRINKETNEWEISVDEGVTWTSTGVNATGPVGPSGGTGDSGGIGPVGPEGPSGNSVFAEDGVDVQDDYVEFTLADGIGTKIRVPRSRSWSLHFPRGSSVRLPLCVEKVVPFTLSGRGGVPTVSVFGNGGWVGEVRMDAHRSGSCADYPMNWLSYYGAWAYCRWAGGFVPTRAQWEYAARGGAGNPNAAEEIYAGSNDINEVAWYSKNRKSPGALINSNSVAPRQLCEHPVGTKRPNFLGLYDMCGNVAEVCCNREGVIRWPGFGLIPIRRHMSNINLWLVGEVGYMELTNVR